MSPYTVTLTCNFDADDPFDALSQMVAWASDYAYQAGYRVTNDDTGESLFIDAEEVSWP